MLPFTPEQFFATFSVYNDAIWPAQVIAYVFGIAAIALLFRPGRAVNRTITGLLAFMWIWTGIAYHWIQFAAINWAALLFGGLFVLQGLLLLYAGVARDWLRFGLKARAAAVIGGALVIYAAVLYPLLGIWAGHTYPSMPTFGVTPCPVTIFSLGLLLLTTAPIPRVLLIIPVLWSLVGGTAAFLLNVPQDWMLLFSGPIALAAILLRDRQQQASSGEASSLHVEPIR